MDAIFGLEIVKLIGGNIKQSIKEWSEIQAIKIPECENDDKYDYYFINKKSFSLSINELGKSISFKLVNNSNEKILIYIIDIKTKMIYNVANKNCKCITLEPKCSFKMSVENIDNYEQSVIYVSKDQGISWNYLQLSELSND